MEKEEKSNSEEYEKSDLKKFSKEFSQEERAKTAAEIKAKRAEYFGLNKSLKEKLESLTQETNLKQEKVANIVKDILSLEEQVANYKDSRIRELLNFFEIKRISKELAVKRTTQESFEQDYETVNGLLQEIKEKMGDHHELEEAKDILANFYKSQSEKVREYEKEYESRLIPNIVKKHQAVFVHGIHPTFTPRENSLLKQGIDWKTKLKIALTLEPTLAASTIKKGDTPDNLWSRMGVILREGFVVNAFPQDRGTVAQTLKQRSDWGAWQEGMEQRIEEVIFRKGRQGGTYNELIINNPKIAGFYVCVDEPSYDRQDLVGIQEIADFAREHDMPIFGIQEGRLFEASYDKRNKNLVLGNELAPEDILSEGFELSEAQKQQITSELFEDSPFRIKSPEAQYIDSRGFGQQTYIEINVPKNPAAFPGETQVYKRAYRENGNVIEDGEEVKLIAELPLIGATIQYLMTKHGLWWRRENKNTQEVYVSSTLKTQDLNEEGYIEIGFMTHKLGAQLTNNEVYLSRVEAALLRVNSERGALSPEMANWQKESYDEWLNKLVFHLYGFGEQAGMFGDTKTKERAFKIANEFLSLDKYQEIIKRRLGPKGEFRITKEDIE